MNQVRDEQRAIYNQIGDIKKIIGGLKKKLDDNKKEDQEKEEKQELDADGKPIKKKRQLTKEEIELKEQKDAIY